MLVPAASSTSNALSPGCLELSRFKQNYRSVPLLDQNTADAGLTVEQKALSQLVKSLQFISPASLDIADLGPCFYRAAQLVCPGDYIEGQLVIDVLVRRFLPGEELGPEPANGADNRDPCHNRLENVSITNVELNTATSLAGKLVECRLKIQRTKVDAAECQSVQRIGQLIVINEWRSENFERPGRAAAF